MVRLAPTANPPLVIPKPDLSARNLLLARGETADSSRHNTAFRNDNHVGDFPSCATDCEDQTPLITNGGGRIVLWDEV